MIFSSFHLMKTTVQEVESLCLIWFITEAFITFTGPSLYREKKTELNAQAKCNDKITWQMYMWNVEIK